MLCRGRGVQEELTPEQGIAPPGRRMTGEQPPCRPSGHDPVSRPGGRIVRSSETESPKSSIKLLRNECRVEPCRCRSLIQKVGLASGRSNATLRLYFLDFKPRGLATRLTFGSSTIPDSEGARIPMPSRGDPAKRIGPAVAGRDRRVPDRSNF